MRIRIASSRRLIPPPLNFSHLDLTNLTNTPQQDSSSFRVGDNSNRQPSSWQSFQQLQHQNPAAQASTDSPNDFALLGNLTDYYAPLLGNYSLTLNSGLSTPPDYSYSVPQDYRTVAFLSGQTPPAWVEQFQGLMNLSPADIDRLSGDLT